MIRRYFKKFSDVVHIRKGYVPLFGDLLALEELGNNNRAGGNSVLRQIYRENEGKPITLFMRANTPMLLIHDPVLMEEFSNLPIEKFDRVREYPKEGDMEIFVDLETKD